MILVDKLRHGYRREISPEERLGHVTALKSLVSTLNSKLAAHRINRDAESGFPDEFCNFDAFLMGRGGELIQIVSVGDVDKPSDTGMFLHMYVENYGEVVSLQTAKKPEAVGNAESDWLSGYNAEQLELMETVVAGAEVVDKDDFEKTRKAFRGY